ncbi:MAG: hypothetical protein N7Q72_02800 [Spiroplasma sp. Tabriz.8]|nr:hypothetical protein [Spiroplasma sp. Tabriz.8]
MFRRLTISSYYRFSLSLSLSLSFFFGKTAFCIYEFSKPRKW